MSVEVEEVPVEVEEMPVEVEEVSVEVEEVSVEVEEVSVEVEEVAVEVEEVPVEVKEVPVMVEEVQVHLRVEVHLLENRSKPQDQWTFMMTVKTQNKKWTDLGRTLCPAATNGFSQPTQLRMYNYADATVFEFFLACFPSNLVDDICILMMQKGREQRKGCPFTVTKGDFWLFMGYLLYILCHPMDLPIQDYWEGSLSTKYESCSAFVKHDIGKFGLSYGRFRRLMQAFTLPQHPGIEGQNDPFRFIRRQMEVLAAIDKDKQPMSLIGTAGTTNMGTTLMMTNQWIQKEREASSRTVIPWDTAECVVLSHDGDVPALPKVLLQVCSVVLWITEL
eukprot:Em0001g273a